MHVELYSDGDPSQFEDIPAKVYLRLRHLSASYFRDGNGETKEFRQKLVSERTFHFNRFEITDTEKCNERKKQGESKYYRCSYTLACVVPLLIPWVPLSVVTLNKCVVDTFFHRPSIFP